VSVFGFVFDGFCGFRGGETRAIDVVMVEGRTDVVIAGYLGLSLKTAGMTGLFIINIHSQQHFEC